MKVFSVYDDKAKAYLSPFTAKTTGIALRMFTAAANDTNHEFNRFSKDYHLIELGTFEESTGKIEMLEHGNNLGSAFMFKEDVTEPEQLQPTKLEVYENESA